MTEPVTLFDPPFEILTPAAQCGPVVFNSPHSGRVYPQAFLAQARLAPPALRRSEDCHVDVLFSHVTASGAPLLRAGFPRAYLDVNREPGELDPGMFSGSVPRHLNASSVRVAGGLGTIPRVVSENEEIYPGRIPFAEAEMRLARLYHPYHAALRGLTDATAARFGAVLLVDCHSMPSSAAAPSLSGLTTRPDIVLGDRHGQACAAPLTELWQQLFEAEGLKVVRNKPYAGGYITQLHGRPANGRHALQIEINRALYMNEKTLEPHDGFELLRAILARTCQRAIEETARLLLPPALAAE